MIGLLKVYQGAAEYRAGCRRFARPFHFPRTQDERAFKEALPSREVLYQGGPRFKTTLTYGGGGMFPAPG